MWWQCTRGRGIRLSSWGLEADVCIYFSRFFSSLWGSSCIVYIRVFLVAPVTHRAGLYSVCSDPSFSTVPWYSKDAFSV